MPSSSKIPNPYFLETHNTLSTADFRTILGNIFSVNGSVNFYMVHGGTNFGYMNGANILGKGPVPSCHEYFTLKGTIRQDFLIFVGGWFMWRYGNAKACTEYSCNPTVTPKKIHFHPCVPHNPFLTAALYRQCHTDNF